MLHGDQHGFGFNYFHDQVLDVLKIEFFFQPKEANFNNKNSRIFIQQNRVHTLCQVCYRQFN